ncbi:MAG: hypothetical protein AAGK78_17670 [Planctomycetota bacterium]
MDTLIAARDAVANKEISAEELTRQYLAAIEARDGKINAFISTDAQRALRIAADVDAGRITGHSPACRSP